MDCTPLGRRGSVRTRAMPRSRRPLAPTATVQTIGVHPCRRWGRHVCSRPVVAGGSRWLRGPKSVVMTATTDPDRDWVQGRKCLKEHHAACKIQWELGAEDAGRSWWNLRYRYRRSRAGHGNMQSAIRNIRFGRCCHCGGGVLGDHWLRRGFFGELHQPGEYWRHVEPFRCVWRVDCVAPITERRFASRCVCLGRLDSSSPQRWERLDTMS